MTLKRGFNPMMLGVLCIALCMALLLGGCGRNNGSLVAPSAAQAQLAAEQRGDHSDPATTYKADEKEQEEKSSFFLDFLI
ncbi:MAG: hypothetical protein HWE23_13860 [Rhodobacteraceae bacterium]|nr:hypothetical protein [Paracoccaceae bacterium]